MRKYQSHKIVEAAPIIAAEFKQDGSGKTAATSAPPLPGTWPSTREVELTRALAALTDAFIDRHGCFPIDRTSPMEIRWHEAMVEAYRLIGQGGTGARAEAMAKVGGAQGFTTYRYPAVFIEQAGQHKGEYLVQFIDLPEARTFGTTLAQARERAVDCLATALRGRLQRGEPLPGGGPLSDGEEIVECTL